MTTKISGSNVDTPSYATGGSVIKQLLQSLFVSYAAVATGTSTFALGSTPTSSSGDQYMAIAVTPKVVGSRIEVRAIICLSNSSSAHWSSAGLFLGSTPIAAATQFQPTSTGGVQLELYAEITTTSLTTLAFTVRAGGQAGAGTTTFNGNNASAYFPGVPTSNISAKEYTS